MVYVDVEANTDLQRWLNVVAGRYDRSRRFAVGKWWSRRADGAWVTPELIDDVMIDPRDMRRNGRAPSLVIDGDFVDAFAKRRAKRASQGDIDDALRGLEPTLVVDDDGRERHDYKAIPLKNADGSLSKYAKNLMDLHAPAREAEEEISQRFSMALPPLEDRQ